MFSVFSVAASEMILAVSFQVVTIPDSTCNLSSLVSEDFNRF